MHLRNGRLGPRSLVLRTGSLFSTFLALCWSMAITVQGFSLIPSIARSPFLLSHVHIGVSRRRFSLLFLRLRQSRMEEWRDDQRLDDNRAINGVPTNTTLQTLTATASSMKRFKSLPSATWSQYNANSTKFASTTLGDIMSSRNGLVMSQEDSPTFVGTSRDSEEDRKESADQTSDTSLASRYGIHDPLNRMALTANGNLQRLVSSYYDAPVQVVVDSCRKRSSNVSSNVQIMSRPIQLSGAATAQVWDRVVHLTVFGKTFCTATSVITVYDELCQSLVESGQVGLGQLFRYLDLLPEFTLHNAGVHQTGKTMATKKVGRGGGRGRGEGFWRDYTLSCAEISCRIHEDFQQGIWDLQPVQEEQ
ncbi:predicted protein [Phaeodactylum tricornutum CCAP 1055/1]|jgi:hypothetical protein|uniref:Uncharacterized protein n=2 Tax=Phaeodactylum tricornutum TaxID=2850 RepID=B7G8T3_PHATC|nr:predicted protein [Phaeodactylum tricornutum CCAP 1055/1]EEC45099.1 predicted protein [Phaeodactylum tricornutum CCAP 1055/1]|eukprot:XP_002183399.1 predicted protein [Phaeodactylum tricornutum CCAP 1055/1]